MFQDKLLRMLWTQDDPAVITNRLDTEGPLEPDIDSVHAVDSRVLELAVELVKRWDMQTHSSELTDP